MGGGGGKRCVCVCVCARVCACVCVCVCVCVALDVAVAEAALAHFAVFFISCKTARFHVCGPPTLDSLPLVSLVPFCCVCICACVCGGRMCASAASWHTLEPAHSPSSPFRLHSTPCSLLCTFGSCLCVQTYPLRCMCVSVCLCLSVFKPSANRASLVGSHVALGCGFCSAV